MTEEIQKPYTISFSFKISTERRYTNTDLVSVHVLAESVPIGRLPEFYLKERFQEMFERKFNEHGDFPIVGDNLA